MATMMNTAHHRNRLRSQTTAARWGWLVLGLSLGAHAGASRFDIAGFAVEGAPLLDGGDFSRFVAPFIGRQKNAADIENARRQLQRAYADLGYCAVQVVVPKAEPDAGIVTFRISEAGRALVKDCLPPVALEPVRGAAGMSASAPADANSAAGAEMRVASSTQSASDVRLAIHRTVTERSQDRALAMAHDDTTQVTALHVMQAASEVREELSSTQEERAPGKKTASNPPTLIAQAAQDAAATSDQATAAPSLKFDIDRYKVDGNTLLKPDAINRILQAFTGKQKDFADVQRALEALQTAYQNAGWSAVQVTLPEQELERGEVRFEVIETRIGTIELQAGEYFNEANVRRSLPALVTGSTPNSLAISRSLKIANENPSKQTQVSLKAGSKDGEVDAVVKTVDESPRKYSLSVDNSGTSQTGQMRLGLGFQHANVWNRDHQLTLQFITNPDHVSKVTVLGAGYHVPLYGSGDSLDFVLGYSDVDSGTIPQVNLNVTGAGLVALARYNRHFNRIEDYEHKLTFGLDYKAFQSRVTTSAGTALVPDITLHPVSIAYAGELRRAADYVNFYGSFAYNPFPGGNDAAQSDFSGSPGSQFPNGARARATAEYAIWRFGAGYTRSLPAEWTLRLAANAQTTRNALVAGEQFGLGGASSVRGFNERAYSNDKGHQATIELYTPDLAGKLKLAGSRLKLLAFYDTGSLGRNLLQPGEQTGLSVDSVGLGLRLNLREKFIVHVDFAQVLHDGGRDAGIPDGRRNSNTLHASAVLLY